MSSDYQAATGGGSGGDFEVELRDRFALIRPRGDVDLKNAAVFRSRTVDLIAQHQVVVVDLDALDYIDSSGLAALMMCHRFATERGRRLAVVCSVSRFRRSFELRGVDLAMHLYSSTDDVLADQPDASET